MSQVVICEDLQRLIFEGKLRAKFQRLGPQPTSSARELPLRAGRGRMRESVLVADAQIALEKREYGAGAEDASLLIAFFLSSAS